MILALIKHLPLDVIAVEYLEYVPEELRHKSLEEIRKDSDAFYLFLESLLKDFRADG